MVTTGAKCKDLIKSSPPTNQHPVFCRQDTLPTSQPTVSKHWMEISFQYLLGKYREITDPAALLANPWWQFSANVFAGDVYNNIGPCTDVQVRLVAGRFTGPRQPSGVCKHGDDTAPVVAVVGKKFVNDASKSPPADIGVTVAVDLQLQLSGNAFEDDLVFCRQLVDDTQERRRMLTARMPRRASHTAAVWHHAAHNVGDKLVGNRLYRF